MAISPNVKDREHSKFTENADGNVAVRVIHTAPNPSEQPGPTGIELSNQTIDSGSVLGTVVGDLDSDGGIGPYTYTIISDPDGKFDISGDSLITDGPVDVNVDPTHNVTIRTTDSNNKTFTKSFLIVVQDTDTSFVNNNATELNGTSSLIAIDNSNNFGGGQAGGNDYNTVSYWSIEPDDDPTAGTGIIIDRFGSNDGTPVGSSDLTLSPDTAGGVSTNSINLSTGQSQYIEIPNNPDLQITDKITVQGWVKPSFVANAMEIASKWSAVADQRSWLFRFEGSSNKLRVYLSPDGTNTAMKIYEYNNVLPNNTWSHIGFTFESNTLELYVDGLKIAPGDITIVSGGIVNNLHNSTTQIKLGTLQGGGGPNVNFYNGLIDNFAIHNEVLSEVSMFEIYNNGAPINIADSSASSFSHSFWFKSNALTITSPQYLIDSIENPTTDNGIDCQILPTASSSDILLNMKSGSGSQLKAYGYDINGIYDRNWHFACITYSSNKMRLFIDGQLLTPSTITSDDTLTSIITRDDSVTSIGVGNNLGSPVAGTYFDGCIDEWVKWNKELSTTDVLNLYNNGLPTNLTLNPSVENWYRFEDPNDYPAVVDTKGNLDGSSLDLTECVDVPGDAFTNNLSGSFDGSTNYALGVYQPDINQPTSFSFWMKRQDSGYSTQVILGNAVASTGNGYKIYFDPNNNNRMFWRVDNGTEDLRIRYVLQDAGTWTHVVVTSDGSASSSGVTVYKNGLILAPDQIQEDDLVTYPPTANNSSFGASTNGSHKFKGNLDEISIYEKVLSQAEVDDIYNAGVPTNLKKLSSAPQMKQWLRFGDLNSKSGSILIDGSDNSNAALTVNWDNDFDYSTDVP